MRETINKQEKIVASSHSYAICLGFVTHFRYRELDGESAGDQRKSDGPIDVQLVHSRDGMTRHRCEDRPPVIANGPYDYDTGCILGVANAPVIVDDEMWIYYMGITTRPGGALPEKKFTFCRGSWGLDRMVSLDAGENTGVVETRPFEPDGTKLFINADSRGGRLRVEVLDESGEVFPGFGKADCVALQENSLCSAVIWQRNLKLPEQGSIWLRFSMERTSLYSYCVQDAA